MLPLIIGGIAIAVAAALANDNKKKPVAKSAKDFFVIYVKSDKFGKSYLQFDSKYVDATDFYEKLVKDKKITYKDIVDRDDDEKKLYQQWKAEGNIGKKGYPKLADTSKLQVVILEGNSTELRRKEF